MRKKAEFFFRHNACVGAGKIVWKGKYKVGDVIQKV
jgi:hypothetical protein